MNQFHILISKFDDGLYTEERRLQADAEQLMTELCDMQHEHCQRILWIDLEEQDVTDVSSDFAEEIADAVAGSEHFAGDEDEFPPIVRTYAQAVMNEHLRIYEELSAEVRAEENEIDTPPASEMPL